MKKLYREIIAYNPAEGKVTAYQAVNPYADGYEVMADEAFFKVYALINRTTDIVIGRTPWSTFYQLSPATYGSYIREDATSIRRFVEKPKLLVAIATYKKEKNIPFDRYYN